MGIKSYQDLAFTRAQYPAVLMTRFSTPSPSKVTTRVWLAKYAPKMHICNYNVKLQSGGNNRFMGLKC